MGYFKFLFVALSIIVVIALIYTIVPLYNAASENNLVEEQDKETISKWRFKTGIEGVWAGELGLFTRGNISFKELLKEWGFYEEGFAVVHVEIVGVYKPMYKLESSCEVENIVAPFTIFEARVKKVLGAYKLELDSDRIYIYDPYVVVDPEKKEVSHSIHEYPPLPGHEYITIIKRIDFKPTVVVHYKCSNGTIKTAHESISDDITLYLGLAPYSTFLVKEGKAYNLMYYRGLEKIEDDYKGIKVTIIEFKGKEEIFCKEASLDELKEFISTLFK